jgi:hypothetical protein
MPTSANPLVKELRRQTPDLTPEQVILARELLYWSRDRLSGESDVPQGFITKYERFGLLGSLFSRERGFDALAAIRATCERQGLEFVSGSRGPSVKSRDDPA